MPQVLTLKDGKILTPFDEREVFEAIEEYAGADLRRYFEEYIAEELSDCEDWEKDYKKLEESFENQSDYWHNLMYDVREEAEALFKLLDANRLNRDTLRKTVANIYRLANK